MRQFRITIAWLIFTVPGLLRAELRIEITDHVDRAQPVAVVPFMQAVQAHDEVTALDKVIDADLGRSGWFEMISQSDMLSQPHQGSEVDYRDWRLLRAEALVIGQVAESAPDLFEVNYELHDVVKGARLLGSRFTGLGKSQLRGLAHHIADLIYEKLTGFRGIFSTRIAYVTHENRKYRLHVADADGYNPVTVLESVEPLLSPAWSPDGKYLAYVSYSAGKPVIFRQHLTTGKRDVLTNFPGLNGAPDWSPDGSQAALVLSKDGNPEIYLYRFADRSLRRLTDHFSIDTEPVWEPGGQSILFTSDRSGVPQLYRVPVSGGSPERLTFVGNYNARPHLSPDGTKVAMVHGEKGMGYKIAVMDLQSGKLSILTNGPLDESPSFAPNGQMIIYTSSVNEQEFLQTVSVDGKVRQKLALNHAKVRESAWSPFNQ